MHHAVAILRAEGNPLAAVPILLGILCGHVYHFFTVVHPLMGAKRRVGAPGWMKRRLDDRDNPNFMQAPQDGERLRVGRALSHIRYLIDTAAALILGGSWRISNSCRMLFLIWLVHFVVRHPQ